MSNGDHRIPDEIEERVALSSRSESRSIKSGQIDPLVAEQQIANALVREAQAAYQSWAHWTAINNRMESVELQTVIADYTNNGLGAVRQAMARDAVLLAFRLSDPPQTSSANNESRITLCHAAKLLEDSVVRSRVVRREWALELGYRANMAEAAALGNEDRARRLQAFIVSNWSGQDKPKSPEFLELRTSIRPLRNRMAHAILGGEFAAPIVNQISRFVDLTLDLATDYALLMVGTAESADMARQRLGREASLYWDTMFDSLLAMSRQERNAAE